MVGEDPFIYSYFSIAVPAYEQVPGNKKCGQPFQ